MFKVWLFYYCGSCWGGGMGLVGAKTKEEAEIYINLFGEEEGMSFSIGDECEYLKSDKEGALDSSFYIA